MLRANATKFCIAVRPIGSAVTTSSLKKSIKFKSFTQNVKFFNSSLVPLIKEMDFHFPVITLNANEMHLELTTHDAGNNITSRDKEFITRLDQKINEFNIKK